MKQTLTRLALTLPVVWLVVSLVFLLIHLVPGDPIQMMLGEGAAPADIAALRHQYRFDQPLGQQYVHYWAGVVAWGPGQLDPAARDGSPPDCTALPVHARAHAGGAGTGSGAGAACGDSGGGAARAVDRPDFCRWSRSSGSRVPGIALGPVLILIFSIGLGWLPVSGANAGGKASGWAGLIDWRYLVLPAVTMGASLAAILTRMVRTAMLEELGHDYIRTARAKGLSETAVVWRHALPNALVPIVTVIGLQFGALLAGAIVTETIFSWPGLGRLTVSAISQPRLRAGAGLPAVDWADVCAGELL